jgi:hypothetical protein
MSEAIGHKFTRQIFLTSIFARTSQPLRMLPIALLILFFGAFGSAFASSQSLLFFYLPYTNYQFEATGLLYLFNWISLFLFSDLILYAFFKRVGGDLQLFVCIGIASLPMALFPYFFMFFSYEIARYLLLALIIWSLMLLSSAYSFGKGIRLDRSIMLSLIMIFLNIAILLFTGQLT